MSDVPAASTVDERDDAQQAADGRVVARVQRVLKHQAGVLVFAIGVIAAPVSAVIGVAHVSWPWMSAAVLAGAAVAGAVTAAVQSPKTGVGWLVIALVVACVTPAVGFVYHERFDPSRPGVQPSYDVVVGGSVADVFNPYNKPGGSQGYYVNPPVLSGSTIAIKCYVSLPASGTWYLIAGTGGWIPRDAVQAVPGVAFPDPPHCQ